MSVTLADSLALAAENGRVCPKASQWSRLYELLPGTRHDAYGSIPASPLILDAWDTTGDVQKADRLREHLQWAQAHGALGKAHEYLASLAESEWHHVGD